MIGEGNVVLATAGKEKGALFIVIAIENRYAYIADGKRLRANKPKKKSFKHLKLASELSLSQEELKDANERINAKIRKFLNEIRRENV